MTAKPPVLTSENALFLDFDGTLVGFAKTPDGVKVSTELEGILTRLRDKLSGALAIVTGREIKNIEKQFKLDLHVSGGQGTELQRLGGVLETPGPEVSEMAAKIAAEFKSALQDIEGMIIERKMFSVAVHYRNAPDAGERVAAAAEAVLGPRPDWTGVPGKMVIEVRPASHSKGSAVESFMKETPFAGRVPVFVGDDTTDEDGMKAATALGGYGVKVGEGDSVAQYRLEDHEAVHAWLAS